MAFQPGTTLGPFTIVATLGAGGMGEVYRARDTKLNREVAIKVLPEAYAGDPERVARFHREAQAVAQLNHPNIAAIYDFADAPPAVKFLVLELVDGDTLADRLRRGPLAVEEALRITAQILEALEVAHERGICHRDLKPANVKLTADGAVKVLDFGLAKFLQNTAATNNLTNSPTLSLGGTIPGVILGTAAYMSPEQAKGLEADHRSDLFSVGCVLYELLTGRQAFEGETTSDILAAVLKSDVDFTRLPPRLNPRLVEVLRRCLEKNPKKRWHAAADVRAEIESAITQPFVADSPSTAIAAPSLWKLAAALCAAALVAGIAAGYAAWTLKPESPHSVTRFAVPLPEGRQFTNTGRQLIALSPDGSRMIYVADNQLYLRSMADTEAQVIRGSDAGGKGVLNPAFSPDGQSVAFFANADSTVKRIPVDGGTPVTICNATIPYGLSWSDSGIVFAQPERGVFRVADAGGVPELIAPIGESEIATAPMMLPGGRAVLFSMKSRGDTWEQGHVMVQPLGGERRVLVDGVSDGRYVSTGHLIYGRGGVVMAAPFDVDTLSITGGAVPIVEGVLRSSMGARGTGAMHLSIAANGTLAYLPGPAAPSAEALDRDLTVFDRAGISKPLKLPPGPYRYPRVSPDGKFVAFEREESPESSVWIYELAGGRPPQRLTFGGDGSAPIWSRDGRWVVFTSDRNGDAALFRQRADGSGTAEQLSKPESGTTHTAHAFSAADTHLLLTMRTRENRSTLWLLAMERRALAQFGPDNTFDDVEGDFSPDGKWIVYQERLVTGTRQVFLQPFPTTGAKFLVRAGGHPYFSAIGDEVIINVGPSENAIVPVSFTPRVTVGQATLFPRAGRIEGNPADSRRNVDAMRDGSGRMIGVTGQQTTRTRDDRPQIMVVLNWFDELRQRVPVGRAR